MSGARGENKPCTEGGSVHVWPVFRPLDIVNGELVYTRTCQRCGERQRKTYGTRRGTWR